MKKIYFLAFLCCISHINIFSAEKKDVRKVKEQAEHIQDKQKILTLTQEDQELLKKFLLDAELIHQQIKDSIAKNEVRYD